MGNCHLGKQEGKWTREMWDGFWAAFKEQMKLMVINLKWVQSVCLGVFLCVHAGQSRCRTGCDQGCGFAVRGELSETR